MESRQLLSVTVDTLVDEDNGMGVGAGTSLREAIVAAATDDGVIDFASGLADGTIHLSDGQLSLDSPIPLQINGPGADRLTIDAGGNSRVFHVLADTEVFIQGLTIMGGGNVTAGGGIYNRGDLTLQSVVVTGNQSIYTNDTGENTGGGIFSLDGTLRIYDSTIDGNRARYGAGLRATLSGDNELLIDGSTISHNLGLAGSDGLAGLGGGMFLNAAAGTTGEATIVNSTFSGNRAKTGAGLTIRETDMSATLVNVTITDNHTTDVDGNLISEGYAGGMLVWAPDGNAPQVTLHNTIVAGNTSANPSYPDVWGNIAGIIDPEDPNFGPSSHNILGIQHTGAGGVSVSGLTDGGPNNNQVGDQDAPRDAGLLPLGDYGGLTETHALRADSPAIDAGSDAAAIAAGLITDQRGFHRNTDSNHDGPAGETVDIGSAEYRLTTAAEHYLDAVTFAGSEEVQRTTHRSSVFGDDFVSVHSTETYSFSARARSGNGVGEQYDPDNRQYFGFASYDIDQNLIWPWHVFKVPSAVDTRLAAALHPGDTIVQLEDATGWQNAGDSHERSLAWYGYTNSLGEVYDDYTYTRNVLYEDAWLPGAITGNTITLSAPWAGPVLEAGTAVRNAKSGNGYDYLLANQHIPDHWTALEYQFSGQNFRPGTAYIKSLALTNWWADNNNLITYQDVTIGQVAPITGGQQVDLHVDVEIDGEKSLDGFGATFQWRQIEGTAILLEDADTITPSFVAPFLSAEETLRFEVEVTVDGELSTSSVDVLVGPSDLVVSTSLDENDGYYEQGYLSLREALALAEINPGSDTITFAPSLAGKTLVLSEGELIVETDVTIEGLGPIAALGIPQLTIDAQGNSRVFSVAADTEVTISNLTITGGEAVDGGGIYTLGDLTLDSVVVADNAAVGSGGSSSGFGGGIAVSGGSLSMQRTSVFNNRANYCGGGVATSSGADSLNIDSSTIAGNETKYVGGLAVIGVADPLVSNSTISANTATDGFGGGIYLYATSGVPGLVNLTVTNNDGGSFGGAGIHVISGDHTLLHNSIIAENLNGDGNLYGTFNSASSHNLIGWGGGDGGLDPAENNQFLAEGQSAGLAPLGNYGGPTQTHALLPGSSAVDQGNDGIVATLGLDVDQRGRDRYDDPNVLNSLAGFTDIGAFELQDVDLPANLIVSSIADTIDGNYADGELTLREAVAVANFRTGSDTITFDSSVFTGDSPSLIRLTQGELTITETLTIDGSTGIVISGDAGGNDSLVVGTLLTDVSTSLVDDLLDDNTRVFNFSSPSGDLTLENLTITGGRTTDFSEDGGGIRFGSNGALTLIDSVVSGNSTVDYLDYGYQAHGGGIATDSGSITLIGSTVSGNRTTGFGAHGGGIYNDSGVLTLIDSTVSDNSTAGGDAYGGGLYTYSGTLTLTESRISSNSTSGSSEADGGGIFNDSGVTTLVSSTISGNHSSGDGGGIGTRYGSVRLTSSTVSGNRTTGAGHGGGIYTATGHQGYYSSGRVSLTNSTVSGNSSGGHGGGIAAGGDPTWREYIYGSRVVKLTSSTISDNEAAGAGGGVYVFNHYKNPRITLENSIVAGNRDHKSPDNSGTPNDLVPDPQRAITSNYSLIGVADGLALSGTNNQTGTAAVPLDAGLAPLANYGGPTQTHALLASSPAINRGSDPIAGVAGLTTDQRGFERFVGIVDIGAVEAAPPVISTPSNVQTHEDVPLTLSAVNGNALSFMAVDAAGADVEFTLLASGSFSDITFADTTGVTVVQDATGTPQYRLQGTVSAINTVLAAGVTLLPLADVNGAADLDLIAKDGLASTSLHLPITISAVNDAPAVTLPAALNMDEEATFAFTGENAISVSDVDAGDETMTFGFTVPAEAGIFTLGDTTGLTTLPGGGANGTNLFVFEGTQAAINVALTTLTFTAGENVTDPFNITFIINDRGNTGSGGAKGSTPVVPVTINAVNDDPVITLPSVVTMDEGSTFAFTGANAISVSDVDAGTENIQFGFLAPTGAGTFTLGDTNGLTITSGANGTEAIVFQGTQQAINSSLATLTFTAAVGAADPFSMSFFVNDLGNIGSGGAQTLSFAVSATINAVNTMPAVIERADGTLDIYGTNAAEIITVSDTTIDIGGNVFSYDVVNAPSIRIFAHDGDDTVTVSSAVSAFIYGGLGADSLTGGTGDDVLEGGAGDDTLDGGQGSDRYVFAGTTDLGSDTLVETYSYYYSSDPDTLDFSQLDFGAGVDIDLSLNNTQQQVVDNGGQQLTLTLQNSTSFENVIGTAYGDSFLANTRSNRLEGGLGDDLYKFGTSSSGGTDAIVELAGEGTDTLDFSTMLSSYYSTAGINVDLSSTSSSHQVYGSLYFDMSSAPELENLIGSSQNDTLTGNSRDNRLEGGLGDDTYRFVGTEDTGTDTIIELADAGADTVDFKELYLGTGVVFDLRTTSSNYQVIDVGGERVTLDLSNSPELENLSGTIYDDTLTGTTDDNILTGHGGDDALIGLQGDDTYAFSGSDDLGVDTIVDPASHGTDTLDFSALVFTTGITLNLADTSSYQQVAFDAGKQVGLNWSSSLELENIIGTASDDILTGNSLDNNLLGGAGSDILEGGVGDDTLEGGTGNDRYVFAGTTDLGSDTLVETNNYYYSNGIDTLDFSQLDFGAGVDIDLSLNNTQQQVVDNGGQQLTLTLQNGTSFENVVGTAYDAPSWPTRGATAWKAAWETTSTNSVRVVAEALMRLSSWQAKAPIRWISRPCSAHTTQQA